MLGNQSDQIQQFTLVDGHLYISRLRLLKVIVTLMAWNLAMRSMKHERCPWQYHELGINQEIILEACLCGCLTSVMLCIIRFQLVNKLSRRLSSMHFKMLGLITFSVCFSYNYLLLKFFICLLLCFQQTCAKYQCLCSLKRDFKFILIKVNK